MLSLCMLDYCSTFDPFKYKLIKNNIYKIHLIHHFSFQIKEISFSKRC